MRFSTQISRLRMTGPPGLLGAALGPVLGALLASAAPAAAAPVRLMAFGDSLTHGYGLGPVETFP